MYLAIYFLFLFVCFHLLYNLLGILWDFWICGLWSFIIIWKISSNILLNHSLSCPSFTSFNDFNYTYVKLFNIVPNSWIIFVCFLIFILFFSFFICQIGWFFWITFIIYWFFFSVPGLVKSPSCYFSFLMLYFLFISFPFDTLFYGKKRCSSYDYIRKNQLKLLWILFKNTNLLSNCSGDQSLIWLTSRCEEGCILSGGSRRESAPCLSSF